MKTNYSKMPKVDLERIYSFTKYELKEKKELSKQKSNNELTKQILGLSEIVSSIESELMSRAANSDK